MKEITKEIPAEEIIPQSILREDNTLDVLTVGTTVYIPYMSVIDNIYEVRECIIESLGSVVENGLITIFYNCKINTSDESIDNITLNIIANIHTTYTEAEKELHTFLSKQITALEEHSDAITSQLIKNQEHIKMFKWKIK